ncbi:Crp/Fnr family transcriptional regulator [Puia sp. P3]|uniref:Crp/Fnr family transcriptional regulator n=1 Tax=Puia sp. P3 TaxID=3423952 RepID=UPI003D66CDC6
MLTLIKFLRSVYPLTVELREELDLVVAEREIKRKDFLLKPGQVSRYMYFVERGVLRSFYDKGEKEITSGFTLDGEVCVSGNSFFNQVPGIEYIQALEDAKLFSITYEQYQGLRQRHQAFNNIVLNLFQRCYCEHEKRLSEIWMQTADNRFKWLKKMFPHLLLRVPAKDLASYMGISEGMTCKVRAGADRFNHKTNQPIKLALR